MKASIALILGGNPEDARHWLKARGVMTRNMQSNFHITLARYFAYERFLNDNPQFESIFLSDVRDVVAQGDLFSLLSPVRGLHLFAENSEMTLGEEPYNRGWLDFCYGPAVRRQIADKPIICAGTVCGDRRSVQCYCKLLCREIVEKCQENEELMGFFGFEQAALNVLLHSGRLKRALEAMGGGPHVHENGDGVLALSLMPEVAVGDSVAYAPDGTIPPIVHQYDRSRDLERLYTELYGEKGAAKAPCL